MIDVLQLQFTAMFGNHTPTTIFSTASHSKTNFRASTLSQGPYTFMQRSSNALTINVDTLPKKLPETAA
jgi:hypothetical protein